MRDNLNTFNKHQPTSSIQQRQSVSTETEPAESRATFQSTQGDKPFPQSRTVRPVFQSLLPLLKRKEKPASTKPDAIGFTKTDQVQQELPVTHPAEKMVRRLLKRYPIDKKLVRKTVVLEQYTYDEMNLIQKKVVSCLDRHEQSMSKSSQTLRPDEFFACLNEAESSIQEVYDALQAYSFLVMKDINVVEDYHNFMTDKDQLIKQFVHRHFSDCIMRANASEMNMGKHLLKDEYEQLSLYFEGLSETALESIQSIWHSALSR
ncbi:hypothetical protein ADIAL_1370 [Alkalibacterium sp. AK22]|uniref:hypothetical protein n=1 Tax=Alkalibacterium sp. AK22 TaxID=1229520 RepID=UPI00045319FF|nr:hypothetical protein [Alkalibacterium sp. AK22]EXJ23223.1 hypothetical protein ADIAL_1370 [Alkalibacterium sp. AK22]